MYFVSATLTMRVSNDKDSELILAGLFSCHVALLDPIGDILKKGMKLGTPCPYSARA